MDMVNSADYLACEPSLPRAHPGKAKALPKDVRTARIESPHAGMASVEVFKIYTSPSLGPLGVRLRLHLEVV